MSVPSLEALSQKYDIWLQTLTDILEELKRPWRDPRDDFAAPSFSTGIMELSDLEIGMSLQGIVRNITDFGAFVDIGLHNDGLVHKSQMSDTYVTHPMDVVHLWQEVTVRVIEIDTEREKVSLSMKTQGGASTKSSPVSDNNRQTASTPQKAVPETPSHTSLTWNISFTSKK